MKKIVYNTAVSVGVLLLGAGIGMHDIGAGMAVAGAVILGLTVFGACISDRTRD